VLKWPYDPRFPAPEDLRCRARQKIPRFAFEYLDGGCNEDVNLRKNTEELRQVELKPRYLAEHSPPDMRTELFGVTYDAPFGVAPIGLQGLVWPGATEILAKAAHDHRVPFILSTVGTARIEKVAELTQGQGWFQLYHPAESDLRDKLVHRAKDAGLKTLIILADVPSFGVRPRDIRNGLAMPPRMTLKNVLQMMSRPHWSLATLAHGKPDFANMRPYMPPGLDMAQLGAYMNRTFNGKLNRDRIQQLRDLWPHHLVLKGVASEEDATAAIELGMDGIIVSNHGGRQMDAAESAIQSLRRVLPVAQGKTKVLFDSGIRSGPDILRAMASGAEFTFLGRTFMYSVAALGKRGGHHAMAMLKTQLQQCLEQVCCSSPAALQSFRTHPTQ
jgi:L-lactate dehydrogenase (cytochrome)